MKYEEWLKSTEFGLKRRYKIKDITHNNDYMRVIFENGFAYAVNEEKLRGLYNYSNSEIFRRDDGFNDLCRDIEHIYMEQIMNVA